jgi:lipopolysaccharide transport system ATP-binding protein
MKPILEIQHISKKFRIRHEGSPYLSLRDSLSSLFKSTSSNTEEFYALNDVTFNVQAGESIGIIGKNGAGKSTLLKILSKITPPSSGKIISRGRIASLLEVGTGFHAELSGRENIFLNGSILGMKRTEIQKNFDAIVNFSGVEKFLDTPLKHYSSGMQLRLAFAVAAFLENEILIIDEVLAVGDAEFQKKCIGKMEDVSKNQGRTLLFVSHDLNLINNLCTSSLLLQNGKVLLADSTSNVISKYLHENKKSTHWENTDEKKKNIFFQNIQIELQGRQPNLKLSVKFKLKANEQTQDSFVAFNILNKMGQVLGQAIPNLQPFINYRNIEKEYLCTIDLTGIVPDEYFLSAWIGPSFSSTFDWQQEAVSFSIIESPQPERVSPHSRVSGMIVPSSTIISL